MADCSTHMDQQQWNSCRHMYCRCEVQCMSRRLLIWEGDGQCQQQIWYRQLSMPVLDLTTTDAHATLHSTHRQTGSQCNWTSMCEMWSHRLMLVMRRAAAFWSDCDCKFWIFLLVCALRATADQPSKFHRQQSVVETSHHLTSTEDKSRQCGTSFAFHHDTNQWLPSSTSSYRHYSNPVQSGNG